MRMSSWARLVYGMKGKWYDSFAEFGLFYRALLQKRPTLLRSLLIVATPYIQCACPASSFRVICVSYVFFFVSRGVGPVYSWIHIWMWVVSHVWLSHATRMNASCRTCGWVMSRIWIRHDTHTHASYRTYKWVMLLKHERVTSPIWMRHGTYTNELFQT